MSNKSLTPIQKLDPPLTPPKGSVPIGFTPDNKQVWRLTSPRSKQVPEMVEDAEGKPTERQRWETHPTTGIPMYKKYKLVPFELVEEFYVESDGMGNTTKVIWHPPTPEEIALNERAKKIALMGETLAATLVDEGIDPLDLVARMRGSREEDEDEVIDPEDLPELEVKEVKYPVHVAQGKIWRLSDDSRCDGTKEEAIAAEAALNEAEE